MENSVDIAELFARHNLDQKVFFIHVVGNVQIHQIDEFGAVFQIIYDQNVGNAPSFSALTILLPIKPAPPVTMIITVTFEVGSPETIRHEYSYHITTSKRLQPFADKVERDS